MTAPITRELLSAYVDDALGETEIARIEQALRDSDVIRQQLTLMLRDRDRGEHSVGAIWRRNRLSCPSRQQVGSFLLGVLEDDAHDYIQFHMQTIGCAYCLANLADLQAQHQAGADDQAKQRRKRLFQSSAGLLPADKKKK